jgi:hypothetical protein
MLAIGDQDEMLKRHQEVRGQDQMERTERSGRRT